MASKNMPVGKTADGKTIYLDDRTRSTHMHIIGSTGEGKTKFMEHMIRWDIMNNNGLTLIDPHGHLCEDLIRWAETHHLMEGPRPKKILIFDPHDAKWTFGFNPLNTDSSDISYHVDAMVNAVAKVWGGEDPDRTPLLKRCLRVIFHALAEKKMSLLEALYLTNPQEDTVREYLTQNLVNRTIQQQWDTFNAMRPREFYGEFGSTINRMMEFLDSPIIRSIIGQLVNTIDFRKIMDEDYVLLVNLGTGDKISEDNARLLGTLIVNDLFMRAKSRKLKLAKAHPHHLYIDECALYLNQDVRRVLDEGRKFGLHLTLAHQHLAQLRKAGEDVYHAIMTDAKTKVIFGGLNVDDAEVLAKQVFLGELNLEQSKDSMVKPVVVDYIKTWLQSYSDGRSSSIGTSETVGEGESETDSHGESESIATTDGLFGEEQVGDTTTRGTSRSRATTRSRSRSRSTTHTEGESHTEGASETLMPVLEDRPGQLFSMEEQVYKAMAIMVNQPMRSAIVKLPKKRTNMVLAPFIEDGYANDKRVERFKQLSYNLADFATLKKEIEAGLEARRIKLEQKAIEYKEGPEEPEDFWE